MLEKTGGYKMGLPGDRELKSMDTGACYLVKKCAQMVFREGNSERESADSTKRENKNFRS